jgi:hypothetical protein
MTLTPNKNQDFARFAPCARGAGLLKIQPDAARRAMPGGTLSVLPGGNKFDDFKRAVTGRNNLTRCGIFRGKILRRKTRNQNNRLEERTPPAPNS